MGDKLTLNDFEIIIPAKSFDALCKSCLQGIRAHYPKVKIIFVLDVIESHDQVSEITRFIKSEKKTISAKRNQGARYSDRKIIVFLDSDAFPAERWIESAINIFDGDKNIGLIGGPELYQDNDEVGELYTYLSIDSYFVGKRRLSSGYVNTIPSCNMFVKKDHYQAVGGMNELITTGEDIEFCYRIKKQKIDIYYAMDCKVYHKCRAFKGFIRQRYVWGLGVMRVIKLTYPNYLHSLIPFCFLILNLILLIFTIFDSGLLFLYFNMIYMVFVLIDSVRCTDKISSFFPIFTRVFLSNYALGFGTFMNAFVEDNEKIYKGYNNNE